MRLSPASAMKRLPRIMVRGLSPPPIRRASPPARTRPSVPTSVVMHRSFPPVLGAFLFDVGEVLVEHDAAFAGERGEALAAGPADQRQVRLARKLHAPGREARTR